MSTSFSVSPAFIFCNFGITILIHGTEAVQLYRFLCMYCWYAEKLRDHLTSPLYVTFPCLHSRMLFLVYKYSNIPKA